MQDSSERSHNTASSLHAFWHASGGIGIMTAADTANSTTTSQRRAQAELIQNVTSQRQRRSFLLGAGAERASVTAASSSPSRSPSVNNNLLLLGNSSRRSGHHRRRHHHQDGDDHSASSFNYLSSSSSFDLEDSSKQRRESHHAAHHKDHHSYGAILSPPELDWGDDNSSHHRGSPRRRRSRQVWHALSKQYCNTDNSCSRFSNFVAQLPAILVTCLLLLMAAVPFGVAYFPVGWASSTEDGGGGDSSGPDDEDEDVHGKFPIANKAALGIRMCLFATAAGQLAMTFTSQFTNPVVYQLIENVPFYHALAHIVIAHAGYGMEALSTLFFLFGLGSVMVGGVFYLLGTYQWGRLVYFFPSHVLVGCIGGIGVFVILTSIEVTNNVPLTMDLDGLQVFWQNINLFGVVLILEIILRILNWKLVHPETGEPLFALLDPVFFCAIVPAFYLVLYIFQIDVQTAKDAGYFLPDPFAAAATAGAAASPPSLPDRIFDGHLWDIFTVLSWKAICWPAVSESFGTLIALTAFSLIQVPIMIPTFAVSSGVDVDMNAELVAHGASNALSGLFGGLQNVMTYSFSILYHKSGGYGKASSLVLVAFTAVLFVVGPALAAFIPRAMAGTLLLHIGIDLFLEGVYDSYGIYDVLEYSGIWLITITMTTLGMTAALLAGIISALSTYAVQSITHLDPIFSIVPATTLRSSAWGRSPEANFLLDHAHTGRARILIVQLQGHLFFGNVASLTDSIKQTLNSKKGTPDEPLIVIVDFTLVVGLDSSAALAVAKMKSIMHRLFGVEVTVFVTGSHRGFFPCEFALTEALSKSEGGGDDTVDWDNLGIPSAADAALLEAAGSDDHHDDNDSTSPLVPGAPGPANGAATGDGHHHRRHRDSITAITPGSKSMDALLAIKSFPNNRVCASMDEALIFAEEILIARVKPELLQQERQNICDKAEEEDDDQQHTLEEERKMAARYLQNLVSSANDSTLGDVGSSIELILSKCTREEYTENTRIWRQGDESFSAKLLIKGKLRAYLEGANCVEIVHRGSLFGELGLVEGSKRLSTVETVSPRAVVFSLDRDDWEEIARNHPKAARVLDHITIRYLSQRVQHVSNRIFETRCLPI